MSRQCGDYIWRKAEEAQLEEEWGRGSKTWHSFEGMKRRAHRYTHTQTYRQTDGRTDGHTFIHLHTYVYGMAPAYICIWLHLCLSMYSLVCLY